MSAVRTPVAIRITRPYATVEELLAHELDTFSRTGVTLVGAQSRPEGVVLRFEVSLADGTPILRGEGRVVGYKAAAVGSEPGLSLRFTRLDSKSKALVDRAAAMKEERRSGAPPPPSAAAPSARPPPLPEAAKGKPPPLPPRAAREADPEPVSAEPAEISSAPEVSSAPEIVSASELLAGPDSVPISVPDADPSIPIVLDVSSGELPAEPPSEPEIAVAAPPASEASAPPASAPEPPPAPAPPPATAAASPDAQAALDRLRERARQLGPEDIARILEQGRARAAG